MSGIVLSASVRQNLLSLQSTASLLATTQTDLATGDKVNTALDNPTNYFTSLALNNRASDIGNLLNGVDNGVAVLQAANTGITSLQKMVATARSIAAQALQSPAAYSSKSGISVDIQGATAENLLGTGSPLDATAIGAAVTNNQIAASYSAGTATGDAVTANHQAAFASAAFTGAPATATQSTPVDATFEGGPANATTTTFSNASAPSIIAYYFPDGSWPMNNIGFNPTPGQDYLVVNGTTIRFVSSGAATTDGSGDYSIGVDQGVDSLLHVIDTITGNTTNPSGIVGHKVQLNTGLANDLTLSDNFGSLAFTLEDFGLYPGTTQRGVAGTGSAALTGATLLSGAAGGGGALSSAFAAGNTINVGSSVLTFVSSGASDANHINVADDVTTLLGKIDALSGGSGSTVSGGQIELNTGTAADLSISSSNGAALAALGLGGGVNQPRDSIQSSITLAGTTLLSGAASGGGALSSAFAAGNTINVGSSVLTFVGSGASDANHINVADDVTTLLGKIDALSGGSGSTVSGGRVVLNTGTTADLVISSSNNAALAALGLGGGVNQPRNTSAGALVITPATRLSGSAVPGTDTLAGALTAADLLVVNGKPIAFHTGGGTSGSIAGGDLSIDVTTDTLSTVLTAIEQASGGTATVDGSGRIKLHTSLTADIGLAGSSSATLGKLGLLGAQAVSRSGGPAAAIGNATRLSGAPAASSDALTSPFAAGDVLMVDGKPLSFVANGAQGDSQIDVGGDIGTLLARIDALSGNTGAGAVASTVAGGRVVLHTGTASDLDITSSNNSALAALGLGSAVARHRDVTPPPLAGLTLSIGSTAGGAATHLTFGTASGGIKTLNDLNEQLASNNLQASIDSTGRLTITTSNDHASATLGAIGGTAVSSTASPFASAGVSGPVEDMEALNGRTGLVAQYDDVIEQITATAQDSSFNGVNLLDGDQLKLVFNETGSSTLTIPGASAGPAGLGLSSLISGSDLLDGAQIDKVLGALDMASNILRTRASLLGSNLSIVQIRQDFSKNLINVLQTGASNLTLADTNEEAANSQALSTRQSIAVSALGLANQSQQSVLQLLH